VGVAHDAAPETGAVAVGRAGRVHSPQAGRVLLVLVGAGGGDDVAGTAAANVGDGGSLLTDLGAGELLVEGEDWSLGGGVGVAGTTAARVEAGGG